MDLFPACIDQCYYSDVAIADGYFSVLAEVYMRQEIPECEIQRLLSLILYKVVDPSRQICDDALQMLKTLSVCEWAEEGTEGTDHYRSAVVGNLPDSYQQFQYKLSCTLAKDPPELSQLLCEELRSSMQRQLDAVDIIAQQQVLTCMAPWIENLNFWKLKDSGWSERLLKSLYYVTSRHGDQFPDEIEKLWSTIASKPNNISPVLDFLITKGMEDCDSNASAEISGAFAAHFSIAKCEYVEFSECRASHGPPPRSHGPCGPGLFSGCSGFSSHGPPCESAWAVWLLRDKLKPLVLSHLVMF